MFRSILTLTVFAACLGHAIAQTKAPLPADHAARMVKGTDLFRREVRAVLESKCLRCHGGKKVESEYSIGTREQLLKGGLSGVAVVPGDASASLLFKLVTHQKEPHMPEGGERLPEAQIAAIRDWINFGAPFDKPLIGQEDALAWTKKVLPASEKQHWAFRPLLPAKILGSNHPIDQIIRQHLEKKGLQPNPMADRRALLRRVSFDLTGLPPTPEEVDAFLSDASPSAYEQVLIRLLASPRFGERWARHWLDLARFAESHGFEHDYDRPTAYHYRDFVIKALNMDLPFDTFAKWQIAGDEYEPGNALAESATGYLAAGVHSTQITANEVEKHRYDELDDIVNNIGTTFLGLSIGCARCHDHKFDPIPSRDYYQMLSCFTTTVRSEVELDFDPAGYQRARAAFDRVHRPLQEAVERYEAGPLAERFAEWETRNRDKPLSFAWLLPVIESMKSQGGATLTAQSDGSVLVNGKNPRTETLTFILNTKALDLKSLRLEALPDPSLVKGGPGRASNGNFALSELKVSAAPASRPKESKPVKLVRPRASFEQKTLPVAAAIDDNNSTGWAVDPEFGKKQIAVFDFDQPIGFAEGTQITVTMIFAQNTGHGMGRPRISLASTSGDMHASALPETIPQALATPREQRSKEQTAQLLKWYAPQDAGWKKLADARDSHLAGAPKPNRSKALISTEGLPAVRLHTQGADFLAATHFLSRGEVGQKAGEARPSYLQILMPEANAASRWQVAPPRGSRTSYQRRALAEWLTDAEHGAGALLARVIVNRLWQHYFGQGIVATESDFGTRGEPPTHPDLLDFLASELIRNGWKLKPIHRLILTSQTYQQSSRVDPEKARGDPENKLVWRNPVRRLEAEAVRDAILFVSQRLDTTMYGPGTLDETSRRRSIYFTVKRSKLIPSMVVFDAPDGTVGVDDRPTTTIAPQVLHLMNNPQIRESARLFAKRLVDESKSVADQVRLGYRHALGREPSAQELADGEAFVNSDAAGLVDFCQVLFCLNEFIYIE